MARRRRNQKRKQKAAQEKTTKCGSLAAKREGFSWNTGRMIALFNCMIRQKPIGLHKHITMLLIKYRLSEHLKMDVPIKAIWSFLHDHWNIYEADKIECQVMKFEKKDFELPQTEEWTRLIEEQRALINSTNTNTDAMKRTSQAVTSNVDLKTLKSVKIMVERLDNHSMYLDKLLKMK